MPRLFMKCLILPIAYDIYMCVLYVGIKEKEKATTQLGNQVFDSLLLFSDAWWQTEIGKKMFAISFKVRFCSFLNVI